MIYIDVA